MPPNGREPNTRGFSLVRGGPFYRAARALRLVRADARDPVRLSIALPTLTWVPLCVIAFVEWLVTGRADERILRDFSVHTRLVVAIPLFFVAEHWMHVRTEECTRELLAGRYVAHDERALPRLLAATERLRDAVTPELVILGLAALMSAGIFWGGGDATGILQTTPAGPEPNRSAVRVWYCLVSLPLYQFFFARWVWRWALWSYVLLRLSRLRPRPVPTHSDHRGGLAFLSDPVVGLTPVLAGISAMQAGAWGTSIAYGGARVRSFSQPFAVLLAVVLVVSFGPLLAFLGLMWRARTTGRYEYGRLALDYTRRFHRRWIEDRGRVELLGTPDLQSLADLTNSFEVVEKMRLVPIQLRAVAAVVAAMVLPMVPLILTEIPLLELLRKLGSMAIGEIPG